MTMKFLIVILGSSNYRLGKVTISTRSPKC